MELEGLEPSGVWIGSPLPHLANPSDYCGHLAVPAPKKVAHIIMDHLPARLNGLSQGSKQGVKGITRRPLLPLNLVQQMTEAVCLQTTIAAVPQS